MRILLFSDACFTDNVFPMFRTMRERGLDVTCLVDLTSLHVCLIDIEKRINRQAIIAASSYSEMNRFRDYLDMSRLFFVNHDVRRRFPWRDLTSTLSIIRFILKGRYDVIHTDIVFQKARRLLYLFRKKTVLVSHDPLAHTGMAFSKTLNRSLRCAYHHVNKIVLLNSFQYVDFCDTYQISPQKVFINRLGPYDSIRLFSQAKAYVKANNVLFFGRIVEYKGLEYLCKAMLKVHQIIPDATLTIAGGGLFYFDIRPYQRLPYFYFINRYIGNEELARMIQESSFTVFPYIDATQSGSVLTSYGLNKPVVASDIPAMREVIDDGRSGVLIPPKNADALAEVIVSLLQDKNKLEGMSHYISNNMMHGYRSWSTIIDKYLWVYESLG